MELLQQVQSPHSPQRSDSLTEADEDLAIGAAPQRIASKRTKSELFSKSLVSCEILVHFVPRQSNKTTVIYRYAILEDDVVLDPSGASASGSPAEEPWPNSNGAAHHYDVASAWMDNDAANEELHRYSEP